MANDDLPPWANVPKKLQKDYVYHTKPTSAKGVKEIDCELGPDGLYSCKASILRGLSTDPELISLSEGGPVFETLRIWGISGIKHIVISGTETVAIQPTHIHAHYDLKSIGSCYIHEDRLICDKQR